MVLVVDPGLDNLLHLHARKQYTAPKGAQSNPAAGSSGPKSNKWVRAAGLCVCGVWLGLRELVSSVASACEGRGHGGASMAARPAAL